MPLAQVALGAVWIRARRCLRRGRIKLAQSVSEESRLWLPMPEASGA